MRSDAVGVSCGSRRAPWGSVASVTALRAAGADRRRAAALVVQRDGSAFAGRGQVAEIVAPGPAAVPLAERPAPPTLPSSSAGSVLPMRAANVVVAVPLFAGTAVALIVVGVEAADWWQHRLTVSSVALAALLTVAVLAVMAIVARTIASWRVDGTTDRLHVAVRRDVWDLEWSTIDSAVRFAGGSSTSRVAVIAAGSAREVPIPEQGLFRSRLTEHAADALALELISRARGVSPPRWSMAPRRRGHAPVWAVIGAVGAAWFIAGNIGVAAMANDIRARAHDETVTVVQAGAVVDGQQHLVVIGSDSVPRRVVNRGAALEQGGTTTASIDPAQPEVAWFDAQQRLPPGAGADEIGSILISSAALLVGAAGIAGAVVSGNAARRATGR